ncbi:MAG: hypothetical protein U0X40_00435 [Ferruginibacter sp.]
MLRINNLCTFPVTVSSRYYTAYLFFAVNENEARLHINKDAGNRLENQKRITCAG